MVVVMMVVVAVVVVVVVVVIVVVVVVPVLVLLKINVTTSTLTVNLNARSTTIKIIATHMATTSLTVILAIRILTQALDTRRTQRVLTLWEAVLEEHQYSYDR